MFISPAGDPVTGLHRATEVVAVTAYDEPLKRPAGGR